MAKSIKLEQSEIERKLSAGLPGWTYADGALQRTFRTFGWKGALMVVNTIGHLAEAAWHHPDLALSYDRVGVSLSSHDAGGVTERDFALAAQIEAVVNWRPGRAGGPLSGPPQDERDGYIRYDD